MIQLLVGLYFWREAPTRAGRLWAVETKIQICAPLFATLDLTRSGFFTFLDLRGDHVDTFRQKSNNPRMSHGWFKTISLPVLGGGVFCMASFSKLSGLNDIIFVKDIANHRRSQRVFQISNACVVLCRKIDCFSRLGSTIEAKFHTFDPCNIRLGWVKYPSHFYQFSQTSYLLLTGRSCRPCGRLESGCQERKRTAAK